MGAPRNASGNPGERVGRTGVLWKTLMRPKYLLWLAILLLQCLVSAAPVHAEQRPQNKKPAVENFAPRPPSELLDIDAAVPAVDASVACPLEAVLNTAAERAK